MKLTRHTDYALRMLLYLAARPDRLCSIGEIAGAYRISQNHLMKVANELGRAGHIVTVRGRNGGLRLARPAGEINIGAVVRDTEEGFNLVDCTDCLIATACGLPGALNQATRAFIGVLDGYSLADISGQRAAMAALIENASHH
ncbi:transcriptional regulator, BadM/Rrf2 family [Sphingomonas laterariae]|uniref:Transcriptional regulator, BadM/Rrf2 family n=1 Tax=Edaphosphingomonas laterariae TaxID=861865 RepID=A0A239HJD2_9SPHN|nr:transcriptional regulator, BadM/Rrf2 family [Sphingomonas laterariae]